MAFMPAERLRGLIAQARQWASAVKSADGADGPRAGRAEG